MTPTTQTSADPLATEQATNGDLPALDPALWPNLDDLITEDNTPVDSIFIEKQQQLLKEPLDCSWDGPEEGGTFLAMTIVGLFPTAKNPAFVPDFMLGCGLTLGEDMWAKENRSYFVWVFGKPPELVMEIVSDKRGGEESHKFKAYARMKVPYYVIYDPRRILGEEVLRVFALEVNKYVPARAEWFPHLRLGLTRWEGEYQGINGTWLRWCDEDGKVLLTGKEKSADERGRAEEQQRRADTAEEQKQRLIAQLKALGVEPNL